MADRSQAGGAGGSDGGGGDGRRGAVAGEVLRRGAAGENDGIGARGAAGSSTVDFQGDAWVMVPAGTCLTMALPVQPDGTPRRGALEPLDRDRP